MNITEVIDYSAASDFITCPRYFYFRHVRNWRRDSGFQLDLVFGSAMHAGMEYGYEWLKANPSASLEHIVNIACEAFSAEWRLNGGEEVDDELCFPKSPARGMDLLHKSWELYLPEDRKWEIIGAEVPFEIILAEDLPRYIGRMDALMTNKTYMKVGEHKTTKTFAGIWPTQFESNFQVEGYLTGVSVMSEKIPMVEINGFCSQKTKIEVTRLPITRRGKALDRFVNDMAFHVRKIKENSELYLQEKDLAQEVMSSFPRNCGLSCTAYMRACPYMDICLAKTNPEEWVDAPVGFVEEEWDPRDHAAKKEARMKEVMGF